MHPLAKPYGHLPKRVMHPVRLSHSNMGYEPMPSPIAPMGQGLLTGAQDNLMRLWSADTGELLQTFTGHSDWIWDIAYSPDGTQSGIRIIRWNTHIMGFRDR